jgi:hypothetical protein
MCNPNVLSLLFEITLKKRNGLDFNDYLPVDCFAYELKLALIKKKK